MKIGLIADTHDNLYVVKKAVDLFNSKNLDCVIHAGDFVAPFTIKEFLRLNTKFVAVYGNNDGEKHGLKKICDSIYEEPHTFELGDKVITVLHDIEKIDEESKKRSDIIVFGHTHEVEVNRSEPFLINPGECCGWVNGLFTIVILDLVSMDLEVVDL